MTNNDLATGTIKIEVRTRHVGVAFLIADTYNQSTLDFIQTNARQLEKLLEKSFAYRTYLYSGKNVTKDGLFSFFNTMAEFEYPDTCKRLLVHFSGSGTEKRDAFKLQNNEEIDINEVISLFKPDEKAKKRLSNIVRMFFFDMCVELPEVETKGTGATAKISSEGNIFIANGFSIVHTHSDDYMPQDSWTHHLIQALQRSEYSTDIFDTFTDVHKLIKGAGKHKLLLPSFTVRGLKEIVYFRKEAQKRLVGNGVLEKDIGKSFLDGGIGITCIKMFYGAFTYPW